MSAKNIKHYKSRQYQIIDTSLFCVPVMILNKNNIADINFFSSLLSFLGNF